jgi:hypothetical protein
MTEHGYHAIRSHRGWAVRRAGSTRATSTGLTREQAFKEARRLARGVWLKTGRACGAYLHYARGGRIRSRQMYGVSE